MRTTIRKVGVACGAAFASTALALSTATTAPGANTALVVGGISVPHMSDILMKPLLGGELQNQTRVSIRWPAEAGPTTGDNDMSLGDSIAVGITNLNTGLDSALAQLRAGEKVTVVGLSAGSLVVGEVLRQLDADAEAPDKDQLTFILVADSSRQKLLDRARYNSRHDYTFRPPPDTKYDITVVTGEYDGMADFPDRWWNFVSVANALVGAALVHVPAMYRPLDDPDNIITTDTNKEGGTTTNILVATKKLPLVQMFSFLAPYEAQLKEMVDRGYKRNDASNVARTALMAAPAVAEDVSGTGEGPEAQQSALAVEDSQNNEPEAQPVAPKRTPVAPVSTDVQGVGGDDAGEGDALASEGEAKQGDTLESEGEAEGDVVGDDDEGEVLTYEDNEGEQALEGDDEGELGSTEAGREENGAENEAETDESDSSQSPSSDDAGSDEGSSDTGSTE